MNVKILFLTAISSLLLTALIVSLYMLNKMPARDLDCTATVNITSPGNDKIESLNGRMMIGLHFTDKGSSYIAEYGILNVGETSYTLDRNVKVRFNAGDANGYSELIKESIDKNITDTVPDDVMKRVMTSQSLFHLKIDELQENVYRIRGLRRTLLICTGI
jgi:hypothetical protein